MPNPDGVVTQDCFNMHPLDCASDDDILSRIDPNHVEVTSSTPPVAPPKQTNRCQRRRYRPLRASRRAHVHPLHRANGLL